VLRAKPGQRAALLAVLEDVARNASSMPGCRAYVVRPAAADADAVEVDETWDDQAAHDASLTLETVRATIRRARPFIAS
jgi:quinol monooxygenase YgiN